MKSANTYRQIRGTRNCLGCDNNCKWHKRSQCACKHSGRAAERRDAKREIMEQTS